MGSCCRDRVLVAERKDLFLRVKVKNDFGAAFCCLYTFRFRSLSRDVSLFSGVVQKIVTLCFSTLFVQEKIQQLGASCNTTNDTQLLFKLLKKGCPNFCKHICKTHFE